MLLRTAYGDRAKSRSITGGCHRRPRCGRHLAPARGRSAASGGAGHHVPDRNRFERARGLLAVLGDFELVLDRAAAAPGALGRDRLGNGWLAAYGELQQRFRSLAATNQRQFPCQIKCILHSGVHALPAGRTMYMRGIANHKRPTSAIVADLAFVDPECCKPDWICGRHATRASLVNDGLDLIALPLGGSMGFTAAQLNRSPRRSLAFCARTGGPPPNRFSTEKVLEAARHTVMLVAGADKREVVRTVIEGPYEPEQLPAQLLQPTNGKLLWLIDEAAGSMLTNAIRE